VIGRGPHRPLLRTALERRRRELADLLNDPPGAASRDPIPGGGAAGEDAEETLRRLMVVQWPAVRRAPQDGAARDAYLALVARLEEAARGSDPRFLDAWNHAYEAIASWPAALREEGAARRTLERYAALLDHHVAALAGAA
jgi:hypothetical protein